MLGCEVLFYPNETFHSRDETLKQSRNNPDVTLFNMHPLGESAIKLGLPPNIPDILLCKSPEQKVTVDQCANVCVCDLFIVAASIPKCGRCQEKILDKFVLRVLEMSWHARCLTCRDCGVRLSGRCYERSGHVYCKDDFFK